ncbi:unnamed protein product [Schistosoma margrebowiei]|uniref:Uncharacterized protein n=1 Tax=Schistosoma margrebowiei TaxID=48269 RepID=A0A183N5F7_9TREM|nr:unnamed protein product [Schistosoma margrebowiei]
MNSFTKLAYSRHLLTSFLTTFSSIYFCFTASEIPSHTSETIAVDTASEIPSHTSEPIAVDTDQNMLNSPLFENVDRIYSAFMMSSSSAGTISFNRSSLRGDDVFISWFKSSCFDKDLASDSTSERMSVSCLKTVFDSLLILSILFDLDVELIIKLETESSSIRCGVRPIQTLSASKGVAEHGE